MSAPTPPDSVRELASRRAEARGARDWDLADRLRAEIEAAGWLVVDRGLDWRLQPAAPPDFVDDGGSRYGTWRTVPSRLSTPPDGPFSVHLLAEDWPGELSRCLAALRVHAPAGTQVVVTANRPSSDQAEALAQGSPDTAPIGGRPVEVIRTSERLGHAGARNVGLRRSAGAIVVLADASIEAQGDPLGPLADALADPGVAVAGPFGLTGSDLRHFRESESPSVDAIEGSWLAFRRPDIEALGPLDEQFTFPGYLDIWWSLALRSGSDGSPRRAVRVALPVIRHEHADRSALRETERERLGKRNSYRVLDRFRSQPELLGNRTV